MDVPSFRETVACLRLRSKSVALLGQRSGSRLECQYLTCIELALNIVPQYLMKDYVKSGHYGEDRH